MLYYPFKNYSEFKSIFGIIEHGNGVKSRSNKILLSLFKSGTWVLHTPFMAVTDMVQLKKVAFDLVMKSGDNDDSLLFPNNLNGMTFWSSLYSTDEWDGICEDGSLSFVRYINKETDRVYKMKGGKFIRALILDTTIGKQYPEQLINWLSEEFTASWLTYTKGKMPDVTLHIDEDFQKIYSYSSCLGSFGSCMQSDSMQHWKFYRDSVKAHAAYLENNDGKIIARAILFDEITDENGNIYRGLERQYSSDESEFYKRLLIQKCLDAKAIDIYKQCGAGCRDSRLWVDLEGNSLADSKFSIDCDIEWDDHLAYQDSFKWLSGNTAYNYEPRTWDYELDRTDDYLDDEDDSDEDDDENYDDYREEYTSDPVFLVHYHGRELYTAEPMDDFVNIDGEWYHDDDVCKCEDDESESWHAQEDCYQSDLTDLWYTTEEAKNEDDLAFKQVNWFYSEYDKDYYESKSDISEIHLWDASTRSYTTKTISTSTLSDGLYLGKFIFIGGLYFDSIDPSTKIPFNYHLVENEAA